MKNLIYIFALVLFAAVAQAQTSSTDLSIDDPTFYSSDGFRVGIVKPILNGELNGNTGNSKVSIPATVGASLGYITLPIQSFGWTTDLAGITFEDASVSGNFIRLSMNLAYTFNPVFNIKAGANFSNLTSSQNVDMSPGMGYQTSMGIQINRHFGIDLGYVVMAQRANANVQAADLVSSGFEGSVYATF